MKKIERQKSFSNKKTILHLITTFERGGAQKILADICKPDKASLLSHIIICLAGETDFSNFLISKNYKIYHLKATNILETPLVLIKLFKLIKKIKPDIIQTWLYHSDFLGSLVKILNPKIKLIWSIHHASDSLEFESLHTKIVFNILLRISKYIPDKIIFCSDFSYRVHKSLGYELNKSIIINNGINKEVFRPNIKLRKNFRSNYAINENKFIIGMASRFDPNKGIDIFLDIIQKLEKINFDALYIMCGYKISKDNNDLKRLIVKRNLNQKIILLGELPDTHIFFNSIDLLICPSRTESFGLVVLEALSCGTKVLCSKLEPLENLVGSNYVVENNNIDIYIKKIIKSKKEFNYKKFFSEDFKDSSLINYDIKHMIARYNNIYSEFFKK